MVAIIYPSRVCDGGNEPVLPPHKRIQPDSIGSKNYGYQMLNEKILRKFCLTSRQDKHSIKTLDAKVAITKRDSAHAGRKGKKCRP